MSEIKNQVAKIDATIQRLLARKEQRRSMWKKIVDFVRNPISFIRRRRQEADEEMRKRLLQRIAELEEEKRKLEKELENTMQQLSKMKKYRSELIERLEIIKRSGVDKDIGGFEP